MAAVAHNEKDFIPFVFQCLKQKGGKVTFAQLREYMEDHFPFNRRDRAVLPSLGCPTWHQRLRNLKSNKTLLLNFRNIREIRGGFKLAGVR